MLHMSVPMVKLQQLETVDTTTLVIRLAALQQWRPIVIWSVLQ